MTVEWQGFGFGAKPQGALVSDDEPAVTPPEITSDIWLRTQENLLLFGNALRVIAKASEEPDIMKVAINAIIRSGLRDTFLSEEL